MKGKMKDKEKSENNVRKRLSELIQRTLGKRNIKRDLTN
jgi:hypothetical protein